MAQALARQEAQVQQQRPGAATARGATPTTQPLDEKAGEQVEESPAAAGGGGGGLDGICSSSLVESSVQSAQQPQEQQLHTQLLP